MIRQCPVGAAATGRLDYRNSFMTPDLEEAMPTAAPLFQVSGAAQHMRINALGKREC